MQFPLSFNHYKIIERCCNLVSISIEDFKISQYPFSDITIPRYICIIPHQENTVKFLDRICEIENNKVVFFNSNDICKIKTLENTYIYGLFE